MRRVTRTEDEDDLQAYLDRLVAEAPPLTDGQLAVLRPIFGSAAS